MKKAILVSIISSCTFFFALASPLVAADIKIGFVDPIVLIQSAPQSEAALQQLEQEFGPRNDEILELQNDIQVLEIELEKNALVWTEGEIQNARREIDTLQRRATRSQEEAREDYNLRRNEELARIQGIIRDVVVTIAKDEGFDLILETGVVYVSSRINLTNRILEELQELENR